ncbi:MAG: methyltransferase domain-containing protein [Bacillota bacterium]|nr:methyltransferase domain-containing protein [Bacillota bacterium]
MVHKFDPKNMKKLDSEQRRRMLPPIDTLINLGIAEGDIIADIGCGIGYFTIPASKLVGPQGKVYALDISAEMLAEVDKKVADEQITNVVSIQTEENSFKLPDSTVSFAMMANVLHEVPNIEQFLLETKRIISTSSTVAVIDWQRIESEVGPPIDHRLAKEKVQQLLEQAGFNHVHAKDLSQHFYVVFGEK